MHGCTEPSSTLHPYAFAIAAHNMTAPRRKHEHHNDEQRQHIPQPWKSFMWLAVHDRESKSYIASQHSCSGVQVSDLLGLLNDPNSLSSGLRACEKARN